ncbi:helix-turn-helix domain-containing protein [Sporosarcina sp. FSL K6-1522]|uniref:helix-turn-helix domain-containing protein n=1 Tax=Sporosarcina sp. FSL K6-1522 TaxID=2921554 RepID=UPI003159E21E
MNLCSILLKIIYKIDGERTIYSGLHLLRGKRSGQTLQDVEYYGLKAFFGLLPKLSTERFEEAIKHLQGAGLIRMTDESLVGLTERGRAQVVELPIYRFNGWDYRGREMIFFARLSLIVQTVSNLRTGEKSFLPIQKEWDIQSFVKKALAYQPIQDPVFASSLGEELRQGMHRSGMGDRQKQIMTHRLAGYGLTGWTWEQLAQELKLDPLAVRLLFIEALHKLLAVIEVSTDLPFLRKIAENIKVTTYLTESSMRTKRLFEEGLSMQEIAVARKLKQSTIEDHFVEMAIHDPAFPLYQFVEAADVTAVVAKVNASGTRRLRLLKAEFDRLSYFQLRLILGARTGGEVS